MDERNYWLQSKDLVVKIRYETKLLEQIKPSIPYREVKDVIMNFEIRVPFTFISTMMITIDQYMTVFDTDRLVKGSTLAPMKQILDQHILRQQLRRPVDC